MNDFPKPFDWAAALGATMVLGFLALITLAGMGGWGWLSTFLVSAAPNWIQGIGSLLAIGVAIWIMDRQHKLEIHRNAERLRLERRRQLRAISIILNSAGMPCAFARDNVRDPSMRWDSHAELFRECRARLLSVPLLEIPDIALLAAIEDAIHKLWMSAGVTATLPDEEHSKTALDIFGGALDACMVGAAEALKAYQKMSTRAELDSENQFYPTLEESKARVERAKSRVASAKARATEP